MENVVNAPGNSHATHDSVNGNQLVITALSDYSIYLSGRGMAYSVCPPYLLVGDCQQHEQWIIHVAVVTSQIGNLLALVLQYLAEAKCSFAIPETSTAHTMILNGSFGYQQISKVVTVYPETPAEALGLAEFLVAATAEFMNPDIPAAFHLGSCVYVSRSHSRPGESHGLTRQHKKSWPFKGIVQFKNTRPGRWLQKKYLKVERLKLDAKGNVYKSLNFTKWTDIRWCIIKQGKKYQCMDEAGRDMSDRLRWQYQTQKAIADKVAVPSVIDFFELKGDTYLVMEHVEGESYHNYISAIQQGILWHALDRTAQLILTLLSLQVIQVISGLHGLGYVHRDLSPVNFMVTPSNRIVAIDMELVYHIARQEPHPHFTLGTAGYMSARQRAGETPSFEDDVFGLGALLLRTFTGISPTKFSVEDEDGLLENIHYFLRNRRLSALIFACLNDDPGLRPSLQTMEDELQLYHSLLLTNNHLETSPVMAVCEPTRIKKILSAAIQALISPPLLKDYSWYAKSNNEANPIDLTPSGEPILKAEINSRKTYYTAGQKLFE